MTETSASRIDKDKARLIAFVVAVLLAGIAWLVIAQMLQTERSISESFDGVDRITVSAASGSVELVPAPNNQVSVQRVDNYVLNKPSIEQRVDGSSLVLESDCGGLSLGTCASDYELSVPAGVSVEIETTSGDVEANNIRSDVRAVTGAGDVMAEQMYGRLDLQTRTGDVDLDQIASLEVKAVTDSGSVGLVTVSGPDRVEVTTESGDADVKLPENFGPYRVDATSANGVATVDLGSDPSAQRAVTVRSGSGEVLVTRTS